MTNVYHPEKRTISEILAMTNPAIIVPDWQRSFSWTPSHVETFWTDLTSFHTSKRLDNGSEYFLGSIVIVKTSSGELLLLDGQQRIATSVILLSTIRDSISEYNNNAAVRIQNKFLADFDDATDATVYKLTLNKYDREFFRRLILVDRDNDYIEPQPEIASHSLIKAARDFFERRFEAVWSELTPKAAYDWCLEIRRVLLEGLTVISVVSEDEDTAADVFETLNDRGIGLSTPDLLRNLIIRRAPKSSQDTIVDLWKNVVDFENDATIKDFLRHFWISRFGDVKSQSLYREIKKKVAEDDIPSVEFSEGLSESALVYQDILDKRNEDDEVQRILETTKDLKGKLLFPVYMSILECVEGDKIRDLMRLCFCLYVRHSVICGRENSKLENVVYYLARQLRQGFNINTFRAQIEEVLPTDEDVERSFGSLIVTHNPTRRYLLVELERAIRSTEEMEVSNPKKVHVEHIYPQTPISENRLQRHEQLVNRIGNLTLLSQRLNTSIRNSEFKTKKSAYSQSSIELTRKLDAYASWGQHEIESRQLELAKLAPKIWCI